MAGLEEFALFYEVNIVNSTLHFLTQALPVINTSQNKVNAGMKFEFDDIICAPRRLGILATLVPGEPISFTEMKTMTSLSDGNLHVQSRKLADAGYIEISKTRKGKRSVTHFRITEQGRNRLREHVGRLQNILKTDNRVGNPARKRATEPERKPKAVARKRTLRRDDSAVWA